MSKTEFKPPSSEGGHVIVKLAHTIKVDGDETDKVTIPALKGKHLARIPFHYGAVPTIGQQLEWANWVVVPLGAVEEMHPSDAMAVSSQVYSMLGKSLATGEQPSE
jgi:hypothetical protein